MGPKWTTAGCLTLVALACAAPGEGRSLSLAEVQGEALAHNPSLRSATARIDEAAAARRQTWAARLPSVEVSEQVVRTNDPVGAFGARWRQEAFRPQNFGMDDPNLGPHGVARRPHWAPAGPARHQPGNGPAGVRRGAPCPLKNPQTDRLSPPILPEKQETE